MGRGSRGGGGRSPSPMSSQPRRNMTTAPARPAAPQQRSPVPVAPAPAAVGPAAAPGGGMMGQIASTAIGVGIGSAVGHTIGHMMTSGSGRGGEQAEVAQGSDQSNQAQNYSEQPYGQQGYQQQSNSANPCELEMKEFLSCAQNNSSDISLCTGFNEILKSCRTRYGMQQ